ncbi:Zn(II)2Cys6 cluster transcripitional activator [Verticillium dahliae VdLs.17]|uniref:Zn(II)2Cys6 cluster transcripitional activator n=1 Tax=Verticillium dahliae (strain VdLs.17 / ATCC MYA-4575 / FGSC 10137) TaxID=498257 RepID=G2WZN9_VERDV|nr:Zn(II)2Cys6 cluster transcripitional activator [Verticillium dahliae VdLs.17]EGY22041.1 Zn(II)2Cys6 cluster transcripitional activator [Verticillium dahliae VdLs.17]KAH6703884.1 Zn(II)2Cys6 cluster transcripitional activator [Verticillium dahliae]
MPGSSFSDNPLLRVSRPVSACSRCRAAKVKCDGKLPACTACEKAGRESECSSANDQFARGKERSYVAALELRVEKLERRLAFARLRKASVNLHEPDDLSTQYDRKDSLAKIRAAIHRKAARRREDSDINSLVSDFGFMSVDATSRDFEVDVSNLTFGRFVLAASTNEMTPEPAEKSLPPRQEALTMVQYYMANIFSVVPAFSETKLLTVLDDLYQQDDRVIQDSDYWLIYLVLAIGYAAQSREREDSYYLSAVDFVGRALPCADGALGPGSITQVQSLILLTQYSMLDPVHFDSWYLIGFACRAVIDMGLHQDPIQSQITDAAALDTRRRIFYCVYSLDRAISMTHARAFSFTDDSINVAYPNSSGQRNAGRDSVAQGLVAGPQDADPALFLFEFRRKQSHWYQILFQSEPKPLHDAASFIWQMCLDMREWNESLPTTLSAPIRDLFDLDLRYSYVYCLAPSARAPNITSYTRALIFEHAIAYVSAIHGVVHHPTPSHTAYYTYHDVLKLYFMATQLVTVLNDGADALLSGVLPQAPLTRPGAAPPPPLPRPRNPNEDKVSQSLRCLQQVFETLKKYGERWENALPLKDNFEIMSRDLWSWLKARKQMIEQRPHHSPQQQQHQQHQSPQQQQQQHFQAQQQHQSPQPPQQFQAQHQHQSPHQQQQQRFQAQQQHQSPQQQQQQHFQAQQATQAMAHGNAMQQMPGVLPPGAPGGQQYRWA